MTINEIVKNYSLNEEKMKQIRDAMEIASCAIERDEPGRRGKFEHKIAKIIGERDDNWYIAEDVAQAFFMEKKWPEVFRDFYGQEPKFRTFLEDWRTGEL